MYVAVNGIYENGNLILTEAPPTTKKSKVVILFTDEFVTQTTLPKKRVPGGLKHLGGSIPDDFNEIAIDFDENL